MSGQNTPDGGQLRAFIERVERLETEKREIADHIKEVYAEAKGSGYDTKIMRKIVSLRKMDRQKRIEEEEMLDLYMEALGDFIDTPLGEAAVSAAKRLHDMAKKDGGEATLSVNGRTVATFGGKP